MEEDSLGVLRIVVGGARAESIMIPCVLPERGGGAWECLGKRGHIELLPVTPAQEPI